MGDIPGELPPAEVLMDAIAQDKKVKGGKLTFILTRGIGQSFVADDVPASEVLQFPQGKASAMTVEGIAGCSVGILARDHLDHRARAAFGLFLRLGDGADGGFAQPHAHIGGQWRRAAPASCVG